MKKSTLNKLFVRLIKYVSIQILIITTTTTSCNYMHSSHMRESDALNNPNALNFDKLYDTENDCLTKEGKEFLDTTFTSTQLYTSTIYGTVMSKCKICKKDCMNNMLLQASTDDSIKICALCEYFNKELKYEGKYTVSNGTLIEVNPFPKLVNLTPITNLYYIVKNAIDIAIKLIREDRKAEGGIKLSISVQKSLDKQHFMIFVFYLAHATCLHYEYKLVKEEFSTITNLNSNILDEYTRHYAQDSFLAPLIVISGFNKSLQELRIQAVNVNLQNKKPDIDVLNSRYLAKLPFKKEEISKEDVLVRNFDELSAEKIERDIKKICKHHLLDEIPIRIENSEEDEEDYNDDFKEKNLIGITKMNISLKDYRTLLKEKLEKEHENKLNKFICEKEENSTITIEKQLPICWKLLILCTTVQSIWWVLSIVNIF